MIFTNQMHSMKRVISLIAFWGIVSPLLSNLWQPFLFAQPASHEYQQYFTHYVNERSYDEKILKSIGLTNEDMGRSFALIAGISHYPNLSEPDLKPAAEDLRKLEEYLKNVEFFDEIVVLKDQNMTYANLEYFLKTYFPTRLEQFPKSRFLFAYSGHGITGPPSPGDSFGYLLKSTAHSLSDTEHSIDIEVVRVLFKHVVASGHHVLALINACYGGRFLTSSFGDEIPRFLPKHRGAHAITAGGANEQTWHDPTIGTGSIFFEQMFRGLYGDADSLPQGGDGVVTVDELFTYLRHSVQIHAKQNQNPLWGDLLLQRGVGRSHGGFFFLNRHRQVEQGLMSPWPPEEGTTYEPVITLAPEVAQLVDRADAYFARQWYTTPEDTNAFDVYREVLKLDPTNEHAHRQIDKIAEFYQSRAEHEEQQGQFEQALEYYHKYLLIIPDNTEILDKIAELTPPEEEFPTPTTPSPQPTRIERIRLRSIPKSVKDEDVLTEFEVQAVQPQYFPHLYQPQHYIDNQFEAQGEVVLDHATGLMWQQSGSSHRLRYNEPTFFIEKFFMENEVKEYIQQLNNEKFAGYDDWRLPTIPELLSLIEPEKKHGDLYIDPSFDKTQNSCWSADLLTKSSAWSVNFYDGFMIQGFFSHYIRAVRFENADTVIRLRNEPKTVEGKEFQLDENGHPRAYINTHFEVKSEVVIDRATGLMWQKSGSDTYMTYPEVQAYIEQLNSSRFAGYSSWRLPTIAELMSLLEPERQSNGLYTDPIFDEHQVWCWSSDNCSSGGAWFAYFEAGLVDCLISSGYVRAVRPWR